MTRKRVSWKYRKKCSACQKMYNTDYKSDNICYSCVFALQERKNLKARWAT